MFTLQAGAFDKAIRDVTPERLAEALKSVLANCQQDLTHRAPVTVSIDPDRSRPAPTVPWSLESPLFAGLTVNNWNSYAEGTEDPLVHHGYAAVFRGVVKIENNFGGDVALIVNNAIFTQDIYVTDVTVTNLYVTNLYYEDGTPYSTPAQWAVAQTDSTDGAIDNVTCRLCEDELGTNPTGVNIIVLLPERAGFTHKVSAGDVIAILPTTNGKWVCVSDYAWERIERWAMTQTDVVLGDPNTVAVRFCDDEDGNNPAGPNFDVVLPSREDSGVYLPIESVISIAKADNGTWVGQSDYSCATYYWNGSLVDTKPILDFHDTESIAFTVTVTGNRVKVQAVGLYEHPERLAGTVKFELLGDLSTGSQNATVLDYFGSEDDYLYPGATITVEDDHAEFPLALDEAIGTAQRDVLLGRYLVTHCQQMATHISGAIPSTISTCGLRTTDASFTVNVADIQVTSFSPFNQPPAGSTITIHNKYGWSMAIGAEFDAKYNKANGHWEMYQGDTRCEDPPPEECT